MSIVDAIVVGAGPAGCASAITLAQAGRSVVVIDKAIGGRARIMWRVPGGVVLRVSRGRRLAGWRGRACAWG